MYTPKEMDKTYSKIIASNLNKLMVSRNITQAELLAHLASEGLSINRGSMSKYLAGDSDTKIPLSVFIKLCEYFKVSMSDLVMDDSQVCASDSYADYEELTEWSKSAYNNVLLDVCKLGDTFTTDPQSRQFDGYTGEFHCYFLPTISTQNNLLHGILTLSSKSPICEAKLSLDINETDKDGGKIYKEYTGFAVISNLVHTCYVFLFSPQLGEISVINYRHFVLNFRDLDCCIAEVITTGAGKERYPTSHRMLISRTEIKGTDLDYLAPHLHLNNRDIIIPANKLYKLKEESSEYRNLIDHLLNGTDSTEVFSFRERYVTSNAEQFLTKEDTMLFITKLRDNSIKMRNNKASEVANEIVHNLLTSRGYYNDN